jgi:hypothetical protein
VLLRALLATAAAVLFVIWEWRKATPRPLATLVGIAGAAVIALLWLLTSPSPLSWLQRADSPALQFAGLTLSSIAVLVAGGTLLVLALVLLEWVRDQVGPWLTKSPWMPAAASEWFCLVKALLIPAVTLAGIGLGVGAALGLAFPSTFNCSFATGIGSNVSASTCAVPTDALPASGLLAILFGSLGAAVGMARAYWKLPRS